MSAQVVVVGSCMIDMVCYTARLPKRGETIFGKTFQKNPGGKGANQCVAASKLGARTALVARLGDDTLGKEYLTYLQDNNIDTEHVSLTADCSSGVAQISVDDNGDNVIIIVPGANEKLDHFDIKKAEKLIVEADVVLFQFETPISSTIEALKIRRAAGKGNCIVNGAPAVMKPDPDVYKLASIFCVNESEAEAITGISVDETVNGAELVIKVLLDLGCNAVILTLGEKGALLGRKNSSEVLVIPAQKANPVDTTGAGDAFLGALAYFMAVRPDLSLEQHIRRSCDYATLSVLKRGTQISYPDRSSLPNDLFL